MRVSFEWLKAFIDINNISPNEIADRLTMSGLEVESVEYIAPIKNIVTARVVEKVKHKNADKLSVCKVTDNINEYQVVCGAKNVEEGQVVVFCKVGAVLPGNFAIKKAKIRDVESFGMIASLSELGLEEKSDGIYVLPSDTQIGIDPNKLLGLDDYIFDISITPNRADCLSIIGVAREIAALFDLEMKQNDFFVNEIEETADTYSYVKVENKELCPVYLGRVIKGVTIKDSPFYIQNRLRKSNIRPINNIVDITNYVMLEYGQPLHTFDLNEIKGGIIVRNAKTGEKIVTLDGKEKTLDETMLVIADEEKPLAVAGVMGGEYSGINEHTKDVFLECAYFKPDSIRVTARKLGMQTDSSYRYERGIDMKNTFNMVDYASLLLSKVSGGKVLKKSLTDNPKQYEKKYLTVNFDTINKFIGVDLEVDKSVEILKKLQFEVINKGQNDFEIIPPSYRIDIFEWQDIAEEIARIHGYEKIPVMVPKIFADGRVQSPLLSNIKEIKKQLSVLGFFEAINYSFLSEKYLKFFDNPEKFVNLINPLSEDLSVMRTFVFPGLLLNIKNNINQGYKNLKFFEIASTYVKNNNGLPLQTTNLSMAVTGDFWGLHWDTVTKSDTFYSLKGVVENLLKYLKVTFDLSRSSLSFLHPGKSADIFINKKPMGFIGCLHPDINELLDIKESIYICEIYLEKIIEDIHTVPVKYKPFSIYPFVYKDISLIVSADMFAKDIMNFILSYNDLIDDCVLFDRFEDKKIGENKISLTFRIYFSHREKTLTDDEVNLVLNNLVESVKKEFNAHLR